MLDFSAQWTEYIGNHRAVHKRTKQVENPGEKDSQLVQIEDCHCDEQQQCQVFQL